MSGSVDGNPLVHEHANTPSSHSHFDINAILGGTYRFGEVSPHYVFHAVADDKRVQFMSGTDLRSLNLKSPLLQDIKLKKTYFQVPMPAILPLNWDKLYTQPNIGDDVVAEDVGTTVPEFTSKVELLRVTWHNFIYSLFVGEGGAWDETSVACLLRYLTWLKTIFSAGSLVSQFGSNFWNLFHWIPNGSTSIDYKSFDEFYDDIITRLVTLCTTNYEFYILDNSSVPYRILDTLDDDDCGRYYQYASGQYCQTISIRRFIEIVDNNPSFSVKVGSWSTPAKLSGDNLIFDGMIINLVGTSGNALPVLPYNIDCLCAYQLACAEYFTNDKVDYVYSSELYRQLVYSSLREWYSGGQMINGPDAVFSYNGQDYRYDAFSVFNVNDAFDSLTNNFSSAAAVYFLNYWMLIFGVRNSLRYQDYFTGAKTRPLAPVDVTVPVVGGNVSMVDVAVKKGYLRFAFAVNRIGRKFSKYSEEIMHVAPPVDYHHAWYLAETVDYIGNSETENTTLDSNSTVPSSTISTLRSQSNRFAFETDVDINSIIIGVTTFDVNRLYDRTYSRFNYHFDRYDMFNPLLQFTGDQEIFSNEYDSGSSSNLNFGYSDKYSEYKMPISRCFGGLDIPKVLPGWCIVATDRQNQSGSTTLTPSFIRSYPHEFDRFYSSLTGLSPATYFHFIIKHSNMLSINRPMVAKPKIM